MKKPLYVGVRRFSLSKDYPLMPEAMEKFLVELFSKSSWVSRGQRPLVAHRSARNLFKPSLFSGVNQKNSPVDCFFERGTFLQKSAPTRSFSMSFLCALGHKHALPLARSAKAANHQRGFRALGHKKTFSTD